MSTAVAPGERIHLEQLVWLTACLALALLPYVAGLPPWITGLSAAAAALRLFLAASGRGAPPRSIRFMVSVASIGLLFLQYRTFNGLSAGTALLCLIAGLKLLETQVRRDVYVITMIIYFLSLAALLQGESFWLLSYLIGVCWLTTAALLRTTRTTPAARWRASVRYSGRLLAQALPLALAFWLFFPRFGGPLWQLPNDSGAATSGLSDSMSPGEITDLAASDEVAFRVRFIGATPPPEERYWRGPVLHVFDGHTWRRGEAGPTRGPALRLLGPAYRYTVSLEPHQHNWLFVLDWPSAWDAAHAELTSDYMLVQPTPVAQPVDIVATSYSQAVTAEPLSAAMRSRDTQRPVDNPRTLRLAAQLRAAHPDDLDYVHAVLAMFRQQPFYYTLTPPRLGRDSVDGFLFDSRRGFCGHYASAFATLMRAVGIPARVVTGYQGGTYNRFADYWILRQSDAHAWDEIWIDGHGWLRIDPTSMIAPERVDRGLNDIVRTGAPSLSRWQQRTPWLTDTRLRLDALRLLWRQRILSFNEESQYKLLRLMHIPDPDGETPAIVLGACLILGMAWLTWTVRRELEPRHRDPVTRAYQRLCRRLAAAGIPRMPHEGAEGYAARVAGMRPDLGAAVGALCRRYSDLRYGRRRADLPQSAPPARSESASFIAGVRAFRPRGSRASS
jgi:transglutaminase-like putative cysteine protease